MDTPSSAAPFDTIVLGAGAAGLMCAFTAGQRGRRVLVLERAERAGKKILISGGGRCNFTNVHATPEDYLCGAPDFPRSALARYTPDDFVALVERHGVAYHEKKLGQLFCDGSSRQIVELLLAECADARVEIRTGCEVEHHLTRRGDGTFSVRANGITHLARSLVVATGGLSFPKLGGSDLGYRVAQRFGLKMVPPRPGLVPLTFEGGLQQLCAGLSGVAVPCVAQTAGVRGRRAFRENVLFTHRGMSGPAILQISSYLPVEKPLVTVNFLPDEDAETWMLQSSRRDVQMQNFLAERLPTRLAEELATLGGQARVPLNKLSKEKLAAAGQLLNAWPFEPTGTEGYPKAEVTLGGVDVRELHSKTMAARQVPGLYFIGEAVDVTGHLGGFNFQWAWASGFAAGSAV